MIELKLSRHENKFTCYLCEEQHHTGFIAFDQGHIVLPLSCTKCASSFVRQIRERLNNQNVNS